MSKRLHRDLPSGTNDNNIKHVIGVMRDLKFDFIDYVKEMVHIPSWDAKLFGFSDLQRLHECARIFVNQTIFRRQIKWTTSVSESTNC
jgi:hypothetical protein